MSRLYVRVLTGFYSHRKTAMLRSAIGDDAFWIPPRLWAYAAENQPDGNMDGYSSGEIAFLLGCPKYATSILQALKDCGYIDLDGMIHDWKEHNGYHEKFSVRAKTAAEARWAKEKSPTPPKETKTDSGKGKVETSIASSMLVASKLKSPSLDEVKLHAEKSGVPPIEAEKFFNYYESNGWRVGRNPMKNWHMAFSNWKLNMKANHKTESKQLTEIIEVKSLL